MKIHFLNLFLVISDSISVEGVSAWKVKAERNSSPTLVEQRNTSVAQEVDIAGDDDSKLNESDPESLLTW